jgi:RNA polymerase primary sigma factor
MAYPANTPEGASDAPVVFDKNKIEKFVELFPNNDGDMERLQMHYFESENNLEEVPFPNTSNKKLAKSKKNKSANTPAGNYEGDSVDAVGLYLKEMSRVPLLNIEEEISLAKRIELCEMAKVSLAKLNGSTPPEERNAYNAEIENGEAARIHLISANTRLVVSIAKKYLGRGVPFLDLIQEGNLGLMKAVTKYDYRRGFRFSTYATWWIRQTITRSIADQGRTIRVPVHMIDRIRLMYKTARRLEQAFGRPPKVEELSEAMNVESSKVQWMLQVSWLPLSLESPVGDEEDSELGMFVEDENVPSPTDATHQNMLEEKLTDVLASLTPREARILRLRFGLENGKTYTLEEVGEKFGLTRERIRQIEGKALRRLRHPMRSRQLREYL